MSRLFGTDGVRGLANETLTVELSVQLAQAASPVLGAEAFDAGRRPVAVVARDPRISGEFIAAAVQAGLASSGVDVWDAGVLPTPAAAYLVGDLDADFGVMISASHNPAPDNGIKFLARGGEKLTDAQEDEIIRHLEGRRDGPRARTWAACASSRMPRTATSSTSCRPSRTGWTGSRSSWTAHTARPPAARPRRSAPPARRSW